VFRRCIERGDLRDDIEVDSIADFVSGQIFCRFLMKGAPLDDQFIESVIDQTLQLFGTDQIHRARHANQ
jgi:hypothetical protein